jgi:hypothetical protein
MNIVYGVIIVVLVTAVTCSAMLLVRRRAPDGSFFTDGDRASGVFGVLATGFSVLLGFIIFLAFQSYDQARSGAETEATILAQQLETAQYFPDDTAEQLSGQLICYGRSVVSTEWPAMGDGSIGDAVNPWGVAMFRTLHAFTPGSDTEQSAYDRWMDQTGQREQARIDRVHGAEGLIPFPLWLVLYVISGVIFAYMLFFADSGESRTTQAMLMGSVTVVISLLLLLLAFFDQPHGPGIGKLEPTAMQRNLRVMDLELQTVGLDLTLPCDAQGRPS